MTLKTIGQHILLALVLVGCSNFPALQGDRENNRRQPINEDYLKQLISENKFHKALQGIKQLGENDPLYSQRSDLRKTINRKASQYEGREVGAITTLMNNTEWQKAIMRLNVAKNNLPESDAITAIESELLRKHAQFIKRLRLQLAVEVAQHSPSELQLLQSLVNAYDLDSKVPLAAMGAQLASSRTTLMTAASDEIDQQNWHTANHYLQLALLISDDAQLQDSLALTQTKIKSALKIQESDTRSDLEKLRTSTVNSLREAINRGELLQAQAIWPQLSPWEDEPEVARLQKMLGRDIDKKVTQLSEQGQRMYTAGQLDSAIELWQQALELDPGNSGTREKLNRAVIFKANYDKLKLP